jgi:Tfp pilus assembly protein PilZ
MPAERHFRAFARRAVNLTATVGTEANGPRPARLMNVGLGGACIEVSGPLSVGSSVTLEVTAPNLWDPLVVPGTVTWVHPQSAGSAHVGLAFDHTQKSALPALVELLVAYRFE